MQRITEKMLKNQIEYLNTITGNPLAEYVKNENGKFKAQIGNYHFSSAYGGHTLHQIVCSGGGTTNVLQCGYTTKRNLYNLIAAYIAGIKKGENHGTF